MPAPYDGNEKQFCVFLSFCLIVFFFFTFLLGLFVAFAATGLFSRIHTKHTRMGAHTHAHMRQLQGWTAAATATAAAATSAESVAHTSIS